ncbi:MAG: carbohydrate porin [Opitutaceae bacterium]|nr:carbohydrate porin [Opitutaceae bacterium]
MIPVPAPSRPVVACRRKVVCVALTAGLFLPALAADPSEAELLRAELEAMKKAHAEQLRRLEERIQALEESATPAPASVVAGPGAASKEPAAPAESVVAGDAAREIRAFAEKEYQRTTESRDQALVAADHPFAGRVEEVLQGFMDIHGYFRAGYGRNDRGGSMVGFQAPGALAKYRLGNEADTYGEITFGKNFYGADAFALGKPGAAASASAGPIGRFQTTIAAYTPIQDAVNSGAASFSFAEIWGSIGNVVTTQPSLKFWAGNRYYRRHDIHLNDFFFSNMSGTGGGFEDLTLSNGKLALAWIGAPGSSGVSSVPEPDAANKAGFSKTNFDLRLYDVDVPGGKGEFGLVYARTTSGFDAEGNRAPGSSGVSGMFIHTRQGVFSADGVNKASIQFGTGAAKTLNSGFETFVLDGQSFIRPDERDSWRLRITENFTANLSDSFSFGPVLVYQVTDYAGAAGKVTWASAGMRPVWHFDSHLSLAFEAGVDWVRDSAAGTSDQLYKFTLAPQVSLGGRFMSRPVVRGFVTYATWGDDFISRIGGQDYIGESDGLTAGMHMEVWW